MTVFQHFFQMGGYGEYVFSAYACVIAFLGAQWFFCWRRWRRYLRGQSS